jgi:ArsR family transcriptional regulator
MMALISIVSQINITSKLRNTKTMVKLSSESGKLKIKSEVFKAMGHPIRLGIIEFLRNDEKCVCEIVEYMGTGMSNISKHLAILKKAGILEDRRDGLKMMYRLIMPCALDFSSCVEQTVLKRLDKHRSIMVA